MRILITGVTGFVGANLARSLSSHEIIGIARSPAQTGQGTQLTLDLTEPVRFSNLPASVDVVVHLAQGRRDESTGAREWALNVDATDRLLRYTVQSHASLFIFASTGNVYRRSLQPHDEDDELEQSPEDGYVRAKIAGEQITARYRGAVPVLVARLFAPYGPGQRRRMIPDLVQAVQSGHQVRLLNGGQPAVNPIYIEDLCAAFGAFIERPVDGTLNVAGPETATVKQIAEEIAAAGGWPLRFREETDSAKHFNLIGRIERLTRLVGSPPRTGLRVGLREIVRTLKGETAA